MCQGPVLIIWPASQAQIRPILTGAVMQWPHAQRCPQGTSLATAVPASSGRQGWTFSYQRLSEFYLACDSHRNLCYITRNPPGHAIPLSRWEAERPLRTRLGTSHPTQPGCHPQGHHFATKENIKVEDSVFSVRMGDMGGEADLFFSLKGHIIDS